MKSEWRDRGRRLIGGGARPSASSLGTRDRVGRGLAGRVLDSRRHSAASSPWARALADVEEAASGICARVLRLVS
jgi:hypothetical protein